MRTIKYQQLAEQLRRMLSEQVPSGLSKLPTEQQLGSLYQVSRQTVRQALSLLENEGLIIRRQGSGAYATGLLPENGQNHLALLLTSDNEYTYPVLLHHLQQELSDAGYTVSTYLSHGQVYEERSILQKLLKTQLRGLLAEPIQSALPTPNAELYEALAAQGTVLLFLGSGYSNLPDIACIRENDQQGGYVATQQLLWLGHRRIGCIFQLDSRQGQERYLGWQRALLEAGLPDSTLDAHYTCWFTQKDVQSLWLRQDTQFLMDFVQKKPIACTGIVCQNDEIAYWLIRELQTGGYQVPEDISVIGFDNSYLAGLSVPPLTTLTHPPHALAHTSALTLLQQLRGNTELSAPLNWELVLRESTAALTS